tara:strand:- start:16 stop:162 length:147 start_codon:yes stop_codon:yes gene_type:complete
MNNTIHKIGFRVDAPAQHATVEPSELGFTFDSTIRFFDEINWFFSDNT